jgi:hypothetical protein
LSASGTATVGPNNTGTGLALLQLLGGSGTNGGASVYFGTNGTAYSSIGQSSGILGGTTTDFVIYANNSGQSIKFYAGNAGLVGTFSNTGLAVTGSYTSTSAFISTGPVTANGASRITIDYDTSGAKSRVLGWGATTGTAGTLTLGVLSSNASVFALDVATITSTGLAVIGALSSTTGANFATTSGNVGIGTSSPAYKLSISANTVTGGIFVQDSDAANASPVIRVQGNRVDNNSSQSFSGGLVLERYNSNGSSGLVSGNTLGTIYFGGNYNTTPTYTYPASISAIADANWTSTSAASTALVFFTGSTGQALGTANVNFGTERMRIDSSGNVGIGTTSPTSLLHVNNGEIKIQNSNYGRLNFIRGSTNIWAIGPRDTDDLYIRREGGSANVIFDGGNVGIGTASPAAKLHVSAAGFGAGNALFQSTNSGNFITIRGVNGAGINDSAFLAFEDGTASRDAFIGLTGDAATAGSLRFATNGSTERMRLNSTGLTLASLGTGLVYSNSGLLTSTNPSDARLKIDITNLAYGLSSILALRPVSYKWKSDKVSQGTQYGFIAQEVQAIMPELVKEFETTEDGEKVTRLGLEKEGIYAAMVKAMQELNANLVAELQSLRQRLAVLESK